MNLRVQIVIALAILCSMATFAQPTDWYFQVRYAAYVNPTSPGDSYVNITNSGASGGNLCVNVYTFSPDEQLISCCTCVVTPNGLMRLSAKNDLVNNTLTPAVPSAIVIKLLSTTGGACNAATPGTPSLGLLAWGTTIHPTPGATTYSVTETKFAPATLSGAELTRISALCGFIQANGSGYGVCNSCKAGAFGASRVD